MDGVSMETADSIVDPGFFESYLGMRYESLDISQFIRRIDEEIYDKEEYKYTDIEKMGKIVLDKFDKVDVLAKNAGFCKHINA